jgi:hypothetical protein
MMLDMDKGALTTRRVRLSEQHRISINHISDIDVQLANIEGKLDHLAKLKERVLAEQQQQAMLPRSLLRDSLQKSWRAHLQQALDRINNKDQKIVELRAFNSSRCDRVTAGK